MKIPQHNFKYLDKIGDQTELKDITIKGWLGSGFADKHGNEIFEGHIVKCYGSIRTVRFHGGKFDFGSDQQPLSTPHPSNLEIIGHISESDKK